MSAGHATAQRRARLNRDVAWKQQDEGRTDFGFPSIQHSGIGRQRFCERDEFSAEETTPSAHTQGINTSRRILHCFLSRVCAPLSGGQATTQCPQVHERILQNLLSMQKC